MKLNLIVKALSSIAKIPLLGQVITGILGIITGVFTARSTGKQERKMIYGSVDHTLKLNFYLTRKLAT